MTMKPATIRDVAKASGVSSATVSYVLNGGPRRVDPVTSARVLAAMERLQYHPNTMARALNRKRLDCLGVVFPTRNPSLVFDSYFSAILDGIIHVATERQQNVTLYTGLEWHNRSSLPAFRDRRVDGLLLIATLTDSDIVPALTEAAIPFVLINNQSMDQRVCSVDIDNDDASYRVVEYLISLGHRRIALVGGEPNSPSTLPRRQGYLRALAQHELKVDSQLLIERNYTKEWGYEGTKQLLSITDPPTAIFAGGDGIAVGVYQACEEAGISIPVQMSVVGFDNAPFVEHLSPSLTTVDHPLIQIGAAATTLLLNRLTADSAGEEKPAESIILPTQLVIRQSTAMPGSITALFAERTAAEGPHPSLAMAAVENIGLRAPKGRGARPELRLSVPEAKG